MIAIIPIATGQPLDLAPDAEFEIQMEQPLLSDELPAPFSTQISFPPTARNNEVFGFAGYETLFEPTHKKVYCRLELFGLPWMNGTLVYDGIEDGNLQYTFTGQDILGLDDGSENFSIQYGMSTMDTYVGENGRHNIMAPLILNEGQQAKEHGDDDGQVDVSVKYKNYYGIFWRANQNTVDKTEFIFAPALNLKYCFLSAFFPSDGHRQLSTSQTVQAYLQQLAIVCPYRNKTWSASIASLLEDEYITFSKSSIPKLTAKDIIENICKILCCSIYIERDTVKMLNAADVLESTPEILDKSIISDVYTSSVLKAQNYSFKFGNDDSENTYEPKASDGSGETPAQTNLDDYAFWVPNTDEYKAFRHVRDNNIQEDVYSRKFYTNHSFSTILCDNLLHNIGVCEKQVGAEEDMDRSTGWKLVRCVPQNLRRPQGAGVVSRYIMTPIIPAISVDEERGDSVYIGLLKDAYAQLTDRGYYYDTNGDITNDGVSIAPKDLYTTLHHTLADWVSKDRQVLKVSLNVTVSYLIDGLKLWRRYYFAGRYWLIKSLTVHCSAKADKPEVEAEFVEC